MSPKKLSIKLLCAFFALVLVLGVSRFTANAALNPNIGGEVISAKTVLSGDVGPCAFSSTVDVAALKAHLKTQFANHSTYISVSKYKIPNNTENINALATLIFCEMPTAFHVETFRYGPSYSSTISYIYPEYYYDSATYQTMLAEIDAGAESMVAGFKDNTALTDVQKALLAHDRLAAFCEYTLFGDTESEDFRHSHNIYGATVTGKAVCQGYALAYTYMMDKLGIPSYVCVSNALNHAWNIVYVNNNYYHVDVTWDDPIWDTSNWDVTGKAYHNYFLVSTQYMMANNHNATDYDTTPTDTTYDSYFWQNSDTGFQLLGDTVYYIDNTAGTLNTYGGDVLLTIDDKWMANATAYWNRNHSCLATDGAVLFYSTPKAVYAYDPAKNVSYKAYEPDLSMGDYFSIYGMSYSGGSFTLDVNNTPNFNNNLMQRLKVQYTFTVPIIKGDINNDGALSSNDYILIRMHCNMQCMLDEEMAKNADLNADGIISAVDYITVQMLLKS